MFKPETYFKTKYIFATLVIFFFSLYLTTAARFPTGFADSDELITNGYLLSFPHPSGYPISNLLVWLVTHIIPFGSIAFRANILASLLGSLTIGLIYLISIDLIKLQLTKTKISTYKTQIHIFSFFGASLLGTSQLFWTYSNVYEVMSLNNFLISLSILLSLKVLHQNTKIQLTKNKLLYYLFFILGLGLAHHQLFILIIPGIFWIILNKYKKQINIKSSIIQFVLPITSGILISYLLLFIFNNKSPLSWEINLNIEGIKNYILRNDFSNGKSSYFQGIFLPDNIRSFKLYIFEILPHTWGIIPIFLTIIGLFKSFKRIPKQIFQPLFFICFLSTLGIGFFLHVPDKIAESQNYWTLMAILERMYLQGIVISSIFIGSGLLTIYNYLSSQNTSKENNSNHLFVLFSLSILIAVLFISHQNLLITNLKNYNSVYQYGTQTLESLEKNSVLLCFSDISCFTFGYMQGVERERIDVKLVPITRKLQNSVKTNNPDLFLYQYDDAYLQIASVMSVAINQGLSVYAAEMPDDFAIQIGLNNNVFGVVPHDNILQIGCNLNPAEANNTIDIKNQELSFQNAFNQIIKTQKNKISILKSTQFSQCIDIQQLSTNSESCQNEIDPICKYNNTYWELLRDPNNKSIRQELAGIYKYSGLNSTSNNELNNVSRVHN